MLGRLSKHLRRCMSTSPCKSGLQGKIRRNTSGNFSQSLLIRIDKIDKSYADIHRWSSHCPPTYIPGSCRGQTSGGSGEHHHHTWHALSSQSEVGQIDKNSIGANTCLFSRSLTNRAGVGMAKMMELVQSEDIIQLKCIAREIVLEMLSPTSFVGFFSKVMVCYGMVN